MVINKKRRKGNKDLRRGAKGRASLCSCRSRKRGILDSSVKEKEQNLWVNCLVWCWCEHWNAGFGIWGGGTGILRLGTLQEFVDNGQGVLYAIKLCQVLKKV